MADSSGDEMEGIRAILEKTRTQLHLEMDQEKEIALENSHLRQQMTTMVEKVEDTRRLGEMTRKVNLLDEQVQYLERRLDSCRQQSALKLSSIEGLLGNENGKLKAREKDLRRKLHREKEKNNALSENVKAMATEMKHIKDEMRIKQVSHNGWVKHVRLPAKGEWSAIKLDTEQNKKALRHIFQQVEKEGGPSCNLDPSLFLHCIILFLWWRREATVKMMQENEVLYRRDQTNSENEEMRNHNLILQERIKTLEDALDDGRAERQLFETTMATNLNQLLKYKYDLSNKVARLEDTVSALHLDNNLLRGELNGRSASQQANVQLDELTAELKARLQTSESELRHMCLLKEELEVDLSRASKRLQTLEQDVRIRDTVCKEHTERLNSYDVRRVELEKMTSEFQMKIWSLQNDLKNLEESRNTAEKERESFLSQLSKALEHLEDAREKIQEQKHEIRRKSDEQDYYTKTLKQQDEIIRNLQRDLTNHREAQSKLMEEKAKRRSLEAISTNHEKFVIELQERMRLEEVDSATMLAEFCETHTAERMRLEGHIEALELERENIENVAETLSNDKASLRADNQRLKVDLERASMKLHDILRRQALRVFPRPALAAQRPRESADVSTSTDAKIRRSSPVGEDGHDDPGYNKMKELEELFDLLVSVKGTAFARFMLGVDGDLSVFQDINNNLEGCEDLEETRREGADEEEEGDDTTQHPRPVKGNDRGNVFAKFRALALMMKARHKLRGRTDIGRGLEEVNVGRSGVNRGPENVNAHAFGAMLRDVDDMLDDNKPYHIESDQDSYEEVDEPLVTKQEQPLLLSPVVPNDSIRAANMQSQQSTRDALKSKVTDPPFETGTYGPSDSQPENPSSQTAVQVPESDESSSESENEDLLSTLEREQEQLKRELKEIKDAEYAVEEKLKQEEEAHLLSLKKVSKYQEQCVKMQLEKEALLHEPYDGIIDDYDETDSGRRSALDEELERMLLEELEILKEENRLLMTENLKQHKLFADHGEGLIPNFQVVEMETPLLLSPRESTSPRRNVLVRESPLSSQQIPDKFEADDSAQDDQEEKGIHGPSSKYKGGIMNHLQGAVAMGTTREKFIKHQQEHQIQGGDKQAQTSENYPKISINGFCDEDSHSTHNDPLSYRVPGKFISQSSSKSHNADPQPKNTGTLFEIENPIHQTLINVEEAPISSTLEQVQSEEQHYPRQNYIFFDHFGGEDEEAVSLNESGDIPEAERDHYCLEVEQREEKHKPRSRDRQSENCDHRDLQRQAAFTKPSIIQISPGLDGEERSPSSENAPNACDVDRDYQKTGTNKPLQKQSPVIEEVLKENVNEMSLTSTALSNLPASTGQEVDRFAGQKYRKSKAKDGGVVQKTETVSGLSTGLERNALSSQQHSYDVRQTLSTQNAGIVRHANKPRGVDVNKQAPWVRRVLNCSESTVASETADLVDDESISNTDTFNLQKSNTIPLEKKGAHVGFADTRDHAKSPKRELLKSQAALLKSHEDRHDLQDQLTAALQTEVRLQNMVDKLQTKADFLQTNLNKSAEFVASLKDDKDFLHNNYTADQEESRCLQLDLQKMTRDNEELKQELQKYKQHVEILEKEHNMLQNRYDSEIGSRDVKLQRRFENEASELEVQPYKNRVTGDSTADSGQVDQQSSLGGAHPIRKQHDRSKSVGSLKDNIPTAQKQLSADADLTSLHNEKAGLKDRLSEAKQTEVVLQREVEKLRKKAGSLQSRLQDTFEFVAQVQQERDSMENSLFAAEEVSRSQRRDVQRLKTDLEAAHREKEETGHRIEQLEIENKRLSTRQTSNTDKLLQEIKLLKKDRRDLQNKLAWRTENSDNLVEERTFRQKEAKLRTKLEEQMDRTFELENQLEENQTLVKEIEQERDILQDDFTAALETKSQLKTQLVKAKDECQLVKVKLEGSQTQVKSLREELEEYLEQDSHVRDEEVRQLKNKLQELKTDRQTLLEEHDEMKLRAENLEMICKIHKQKCKKEENEKMKLEAELEELKVEKQEIETRLWEGETGTKHATDVRKAMATDTNDTQSEAVTKSKHLRQGERPMALGQLKLVFGRNSMARGKTVAFAPNGLLTPKEGTPFQEDEHQYVHNRDEETLRGIRQDSSGDQMRNAKETTEHGLEAASGGIRTCSDRLQKLEKMVSVSVISLQEELEAQMENISRMRECTEATLQEAVTKTKQLTEENHREILSMIEKGVALRIKDTRITTGHQLEEARKLLERSISEQRKQAASIIMLRQSMEKALLQHSALKIRLRQQTEKASSALSCWDKERRSLKKQLGEANKSLKLIETQVTSAINQSQSPAKLDAIKDHLLQQQVSQTRELQRMVKNCLCKREVQKSENKHKDNVTTLSLRSSAENWPTEDQQKRQQHYEETLKELKKEIMQLSLDLRTANESLEMKKQECWGWQDSLQNAEIRERDVTRTLNEVRDQLKIEVEMQSQLAVRSEKQEEELFKLRRLVGRQSIQEQDTPIQPNKVQETNHPRMNEMLSEFSREIKSHLEDHMEKTQLNNETDDRKKIQELESHLSNMDAQRSVDSITIQSLTDDNRRLRAMVYKLRERIMNNQISHHKDSRMDSVYQALARAQVRVIATSMADGSQTILTGTSMFNNTMPTGFTTSRLAGRRHLGSMGNSVGDSYD